MLGSGKTTLGKQLSAHMNVHFVDMDWEITKKENKSVQEIFAEKGEDYFREVEAAVLRELASSKESMIIGTGGGAPCFHQGIDIINNAGLSIFLDVPVDELMSRLAKATDRPLLNTEDEDEKAKRIQELRTRRLPVYQRAHVTIENPTFQKLLGVVLEREANG